QNQNLDRCGWYVEPRGKDCDRQWSRDDAASPSECRPSQRSGGAYHSGMVRTGRYALLLLVDSTIADACGGGLHRGLRLNCQNQTATISCSHRPETRGDAVCSHTVLHTFRAAVATDRRM